MSFRTSLGLIEIEGVVKKIEFTEHNPHQKGLLKRVVNIDKIISFGTRQETILNEIGEFRCFFKIGYIQIKDTEYLTSNFIVNELRRFLKKKITSIVKEVLTGATAKKVYVVNNYHYTI